MKKNLASFFIVFILFILLPLTVSAKSSYVLPYPSNMPGSKLYSIDLAREIVSPLWHLGNFARFKNNLYYADKYLVEAKTLFEYNQYLLATIALKKSDAYFERLEKDLLRAQEEGKDISEKMNILKSASEKHRETLAAIKASAPEQFVWTPEDGTSTELFIHTMLDESIGKRKL